MIKVVDNGTVYFFKDRVALKNAYSDECIGLMQYAEAAFTSNGEMIKSRLTFLETFERMHQAEEDLTKTLEDM